MNIPQTEWVSMSGWSLEMQKYKQSNFVTEIWTKLLFLVLAWKSLFYEKNLCHHVRSYFQFQQHNEWFFTWYSSWIRSKINSICGFVEVLNEIIDDHEYNSLNCPNNFAVIYGKCIWMPYGVMSIYDMSSIL